MYVLGVLVFQSKYKFNILQGHCCQETTFSDIVKGNFIQRNICARLIITFILVCESLRIKRFLLDIAVLIDKTSISQQIFIYNIIVSRCVFYREGVSCLHVLTHSLLLMMNLACFMF